MQIQWNLILCSIFDIPNLCVKFGDVTSPISPDFPDFSKSG